MLASVLSDAECFSVFRLGEPVCVGAGSLPLGGGRSTGDGVSALQQVNRSITTSTMSGGQTREGKSASTQMTFECTFRSRLAAPSPATGSESAPRRLSSSLVVVVGEKKKKILVVFVFQRFGDEG